MIMDKLSKHKDKPQQNKLKQKKKGARIMEERKLEMTVTPERAMLIKQALIKQYEDQFNVEVQGWEEKPKPAASA